MSEQRPGDSNNSDSSSPFQGGNEGSNPSSPTIEKRAEDAIDFIVRYGGIDGAHHKAWVLDQVVRILAGSRYEEIVRDAKAGEDGPETYEWDEGIPP